MLEILDAITELNEAKEELYDLQAEMSKALYQMEYLMAINRVSVESTNH